jgi:hypothetical protein
MNASELEELKESARLSAAQLKILGVLAFGPSYISAIAEDAQLAVEIVRRNLMALKRLGYVTNWIHTFSEGSLRNIAVSAWRLLSDQEKTEGRIDPNRHRRAIKTLDAKIRFRFRRTQELHQLMKEHAEKTRSSQTSPDETSTFPSP